MSNQLDLDEIRARAAAATPGPWQARREFVVSGDLEGIPDCVVSTGEDGPQELADAEFIAHAREDVPALYAEIERLRAALVTAMEGAERDYRQCIVSARATRDEGHYEKCNGRAEAYRQAATRLAELTGVMAPDWEQIRRDVPADGIYRATRSGA